MLLVLLIAETITQILYQPMVLFIYRCKNEIIILNLMTIQSSLAYKQTRWIVKKVMPFWKKVVGVIYHVVFFLCIWYSHIHKFNYKCVPYLSLLTKNHNFLSAWPIVITCHKSVQFPSCSMDSSLKLLFFVQKYK